MLTDAQIEAGARAEYDFERTRIHYRQSGPRWELQPAEFRSHMIERFRRGHEAAARVGNGQRSRETLPLGIT